MQDKEILLTLNPTEGHLRLTALSAVVGDCVGALPEPTRKGYVFVGWFSAPEGGFRVTPSTHVTDDFPSVIYARWEKPSASPKSKEKKKSAIKSQKRVLIALSVLVAVLIATLGFVNYIVDIYHYTDTDGITYTIKKKDGVYGLYNGKTLCDINDDGYYLTTFGNQLSVDPKTGEYQIYAVVDVEGTEVVGANQRVLMFKQLTYDQSSTNDASRVIQKIEVHNQHGTMVFVRGSGNRFNIQGSEGTIFSEELFAQLSSGCGYTISMQRLENPVRLEDGSIDWSEYGLAAEQREREVEGEGDETKTETYDYVPSHYTVTTMTGDTYSVTLGDATVSGAGYYARYEDRQTVYILSSTHIDGAVLQPIEALVTPMVVYPMSLNAYFDVENFVYESDIDYLAIYRDMVLALTDFDINTVEPDSETGEFTQEVKDILQEATDKIAAMDEKTFDAFYAPIFQAHKRTITAFSYVDLEERQNTLFSALPYKMATEYMEGYLPNSDNISDVLQKLYDTKFNAVEKLSPTDEDFEKYGLDSPAHIISFIYHDPNGQEHDNHVEISELTEDGIYYAYSPYYNMIVSVPESSFAFLGWEDVDWYEREYFQGNIAFTDRIIVEGNALDAPIIFDLDNSQSDQSEGINSEKLLVYANGELVDYSLVVTKPSGTQTTETSVYNFRRFFQSMLIASMEGVAELTEEEKAALKETPDDECQLKLTVLMDDKNGNTKYAVYRFYRYTERKAFMTLEVLDSPNAESSPQNGQGNFYVLQSFCDKLIADAERFLAGQEITVSSKN